MSDLIMTDAEADLVAEMAWADEYWAYEQELAWEDQILREEMLREEAERPYIYEDEDSDYSESLEFEPLHDEYPF
jgi:hypothetical protein